MPERRRVLSGSELEARFGYSRAVTVGDRVIVSGTAPIWPDGSCDPDPGAQARRCIEIIAAALSEAGSSLADVVVVTALLDERWLVEVEAEAVKTST
jgi:enamine deaminase RidA (YjgF/YER057c/UK114 family)